MTLQSKATEELCRAMGLDPLQIAGLRFSISADHVTTVLVKLLVTTDQAHDISAVLRRYRLVEIEGGAE